MITHVSENINNLLVETYALTSGYARHINRFVSKVLIFKFLKFINRFSYFLMLLSKKFTLTMHRHLWSIIIKSINLNNYKC